MDKVTSGRYTLVPIGLNTRLLAAWIFNARSYLLYMVAVPTNPFRDSVGHVAALPSAAATSKVGTVRDTRTPIWSRRERR